MLARLIRNARREIVKVNVDVAVSVQDHGAIGDGTTEDQGAAFNAAITAGAGKTILVPAGTYLLDAGAGNGIKLNQPGTRLVLDPDAVLQVQDNGEDAYMAIEISAADCSVEGGTIIGDGPTHTGSTGEWGHLIVVQGGGDRAFISNVLVKHAWGDGIAIQGNPSDVTVFHCTADDNRRQGLSIIAATRPNVIGGTYKNTGLTEFTAPGAGIDIEPNAAGPSVIDAVITGVITSGNRGAGVLVVRAAGQTTSARITGVRSSGDGLGTVAGIAFAGSAGTMQVEVTACTVTDATYHGFQVDSPGVELTACSARGNTRHGFQLNAQTTLISPRAEGNMQHGIQFNVGSNGSTLTGGETRGNSQEADNGFVNVDLQGGVTGLELNGHVSRAGDGANAPAWGYLIRALAEARLIACDAEGAFVQGFVSDVPGDTFMFPRPGTTSPSISGATTGTTAPAAGGAGALPATPLGYFTFNINGADRQVAYY